MDLAFWVSMPLKKERNNLYEKNFHAFDKASSMVWKVASYLVE